MSVEWKAGMINDEGSIVLAVDEHGPSHWAFATPDKEWHLVVRDRVHQRHDVSAEINVAARRDTIEFWKSSKPQMAGLQLDHVIVDHVRHMARGPEDESSRRLREGIGNIPEIRRDFMRISRASGRVHIQVASVLATVDHKACLVPREGYVLPEDAEARDLEPMSGDLTEANCIECYARLKVFHAERDARKAEQVPASEEEKKGAPPGWIEGITCTECQAVVQVNIEPNKITCPACSEFIRCHSCGTDEADRQEWRRAPGVDANGIWCSDECVGRSAES